MRIYRVQKKQNKKKIVQQEDSLDIDDEDVRNKDWWTKYFWSYEKLIDDSKGTCNHLFGTSLMKEDNSKLIIKGSKLVAKLSPKHYRKPESSKSSTALCQVYANISFEYAYFI